MNRKRMLLLQARRLRKFADSCEHDAKQARKIASECEDLATHLPDEDSEGH